MGSPSSFDTSSFGSCWSVLNASKSRSLVTNSKLRTPFEKFSNRSHRRGMQFIRTVSAI